MNRGVTGEYVVPENTFMNRGDRIWMYQRKMLGGGLHPNFVSGVNKFLDFTFA